MNINNVTFSAKLQTAECIGMVYQIYSGICQNIFIKLLPTGVLFCGIMDCPMEGYHKISERNCAVVINYVRFLTLL